MATQNERAVIDLVINGQQSESTLKAITTATTNARKALYSMAETDPGYKKQKAELLALMQAQDARVVRINREKSAWQQFTSNMPTITAGVVGANLLTGAISAIGSAITASIAQSRAFNAASKELSAVTGATGKDLEYLNQQAAKSGPAFGKSGAEMLQAYKLMASAKPELLANKELLVETTKAAVTLSQAGLISLEEATKVTAESLNQFGEEADQANRFINVIAAGAKEGSAEINEMSGALKASGTVAANQNVSFEATNAVLQSMSTIALKGEQAGTMFRNVLLTLGSGAKETNPKIVGLETALDNLGKKNLSTAEMTKLFGKENVIAAQHIISHRNEIATLTEKVTGTQEAFSQAKTNNESFDHQLEKFYARLSGLGVLIGTHLLPALTKVLEVGIGLAEMLTGGLTPASEKATQAFDDQKAKVADLTKNLSPLLDRHDALKKKSTLTKDEQAELARIVGQVADIVPSAVTEFDKYGKALDVNTDKAREFIKMQQLLLKEKNKDAITKKQDDQAADQSALDKNVAKLKAGTTYERDPTSMGGAYKMRQMTEAERKALMDENAKLNEAIKDRKLLLEGLSGDYMNESTAGAPAAKPAAPSGGGDSKPTDKEKKAAKAKVDANHEAILAIEKMNMEAIRDEKTRDLAKAQYAADQEKERARKSTANAQYKAKWIAGIEDRLVTDKIQINEKYEAVERKKGLEHLKDVQQLAEKELKVQLQFAQTHIQERVAAGGISKEQGKALEIQAEQQFLVAKELLYSQHYEAMFNEAWGNEEALTQVAQDLATSLTGIDQAKLDKEGELATARADLRKSEDDRDEQLHQKKKQRAAEEVAFRREMASQLHMVLSNDWTATLQGYKDYWKQTTAVQKVALVASKAWALAEIAINLSRQITMVNTAATIADAIVPFSGEIIRIKGLAVAIGTAALQTGKVLATNVSTPAFALGGFSDQEPGGYVNQATYFNKKNFIAGEKGPEWIMSAPMLKNPVMANLAGALQAMQVTGQYRNLRLPDAEGASGGSSAGVGSGGGMSDQLLRHLIAETQATRSALDSYASKKVELNYRLQEEYQNQVQQIRTDTKL